MKFSRNISALVCGWGFVALLLGACSCSASENPSSGGTDPGKQDDTEIVSMLKKLCVDKDGTDVEGNNACRWGDVH